MNSLALTCWRQAAELWRSGDYVSAALKLNHALWLASIEAGIDRKRADSARQAVNEAVGTKGSAA